MRLIDAAKAKEQIRKMQTLKQSEKALLQLAVDRTPTYEPPNPLLTLEELQQMDGEPVWDNSLKTWGIVVGDFVLYRNGEKGQICGNTYRRRKPEDGMLHGKENS